MNELSKWLRGELEQFKKAEELGLSRTITRNDAMIAYRNAADEIDRLEREVAQQKPAEQRS